MRSYMKFAATVVPAIILGLFIVSCSGEKGTRLGQKIPANAEIVKLEKILANPADFNGKTVVIKGIISGQCPSLCEFFYKEGAHQATIFSQGFKFPKLPTGVAVTVHANVTAGNENVVFSALGIATE
jgi:hypothetical protein